MFGGRIFICADMHGDARAIKDAIDTIDNPSSEDIIIIAGDAGFEYGDYVMGSAKRAASKFPGKWIVMRGNHDNCYMRDHSHIKADNKIFKENNLIANDGWAFVDGNKDFIYQKRYPNIWYIDDHGGLYTIGDYVFLFLPGAYSVDKYYRLRNHYPYNQDEQLTQDEMSELYGIVCDWNRMEFPIDYVVGHTFPKWLEPYYSNMFISTIDQSSVDKTTERWLGLMSEEFEKNPNFKMYYGGHFHSEKQLQDKYMMIYQNPIEIK